MNPRLATLASGFAALVVLGGLLVGGAPPPPEPPVSRPRSQDTGDAGLAGARRWLEQSGVPVRALRSRYGELDALSPVPAGNLLIVVEPMVYPLRWPERRAIVDWVARGNQLLLLSNHAQLSAWARTGRQPQQDVGAVFDVHRDHFEPDQEAEAQGGEQAGEAAVSADAAAVPTATGPEPDAAAAQDGCEPYADGAVSDVRRLYPYTEEAAHPVLAGVSMVAIKAPLQPAARNWSDPHFFDADEADDVSEDAFHRYSFGLLCDRDLARPAFSLLRFGEGRIWVADHAEIFSNLNLDRADNARLFANLVQFALAPQGAVIFDDLHQGDSALYDPQAFFRDPRLHASLLFLLAIWVVWLLADALPLLPARGAPAAQRPIDFVRSLAGFQRRYLARDEVAAALLERFAQGFRAQRGLAQAPGLDALLQQLAGQPRVRRADLDELRRLAAPQRRLRASELVRLRNLLLSLDPDS